MCVPVAGVDYRAHAGGEMWEEALHRHHGWTTAGWALALSFPASLAVAAVVDDVPIAAVLVVLLTIGVQHVGPRGRLVELRHALFCAVCLGIGVQTWRVIRSDDPFDSVMALVVGVLFAVLLFAFEMTAHWWQRRRAAAAPPSPPGQDREAVDYPEPPPVVVSPAPPS